jgi:hypothetical protein
LFESTQNASVVYVDQAHECVYPVHALTNGSQINFSGEWLSFYGMRSGYEGETYLGRVANLKFKNLSILQQNLNEDKGILTDIASGKIFEVGSNSYGPGIMSYKDKDYYLSYLGNGRLKIWDIDAARLLDEIQLFEKLGAPSFFYLQGPIYKSFETGSAQSPYEIFSDYSCQKMPELNKEWLQDQLNQRTAIQDDSRYANWLCLNLEVITCNDFLMTYYTLSDKDGVLYLRAKDGYLKKIQKMKTCLKNFPEITYPPNQEMVEVYRFPGATGNKSFFQKIKETFSKKK